MPYTLVEVLRPKLEVEHAFRDRIIAKETNRGADAGEPAVVVSKLFTVDGPVIMLMRRYEDLVGIQAGMERARSDPEARAAARDDLTMLRAAPETNVWRTVVEPPEVSEPYSHVSDATYYPSVGNQREMEELIAERARRLGLALHAHDYRDDGPVFHVIVRFPDLESTGARREANASDQRYREYLAKLASMSSRANGLAVHEVLVPFGR
jgi:hypothetical protein